MQNFPKYSINKAEKLSRFTKEEAVMEENQNQLPTKVNFWSKFKAFLFQDIKVELTPYQQKVEDEINAFLHQEITWQGVKNFLFQEIKF